MERCPYCGFELRDMPYHERGGCGPAVAQRILDGELTVLEVLSNLVNQIATMTHQMSELGAMARKGKCR